MFLEKKMSRTCEIPHSISCTNVAKVTVHRVSATRRTVLLALCVLAYALVLPGIFSTMGKPLERALEQAKLLAENKTLIQDQAFVAEASQEYVVTLEDDEDTLDEIQVSDDLDESSLGNVSEHVNKKNISSDNATNPTEERPMPSAYLPDALPLFLLFLVTTATALHFLMGRWFVWWKVLTEYEPEEKGMAAGCYVHVTPVPHRGKPALCLVKKNEMTGDLEFEFQRQTYVWIGPEVMAQRELNERLFIDGESSRDDAIDLDEDAKISSHLSSPTCLEMARARGYVKVMLADASQPISTYLNSQGITDEDTLRIRRSRFGANTLSVPQPPFIELLKSQLLMPLSVFQLFSALLWAVDEYIQYTIFTLFTIVMMESTTAYQRYRTMNQLKGLSPKAYSVYVKRMGRWIIVPTDDLLPGDLISLRTPDVNISEPSNNGATGATPGQEPKQTRVQQDLIVPCDVLLLAGSAIVNEATLTGESIPQMKDALVEKESGDRPLDVDGKDRIHTLFSGTSIVAFTAAAGPQATPDGGFLCVVLRTGFGSSQGELMQMIEFSSQAVSADSKETGVALLILLVFALISATYVFRKGMEKGDRTTHELLLKCIIIVTSVVPRQLPVQMALAVNHALMTLLGEGIYCTEPYRVPEAGKVTHALFDKTGTLTADELTPIGVSAPDGHNLVSMREASPEATLVLAACHSLVSIGPQQIASATSLAGDPIEVAAVRGVGWGFDAVRSTAFPGDTAALETSLARTRERMRAANENGGAAKNQSVLNNLAEEEKRLRSALEKIREAASKSKYTSAVIERRFHFEAALQRMSVVAKVTLNGSSASSQVVLCKGSPEALKLLCKEVPSWYDSTYRDLAERGMRVLALGMKVVDQQQQKTKLDDLSRKSVENGLQFVGFVAFEAKIRDDSPAVVKSLRASAIGVAMVTGDAPLTALHVAKQCGFTRGPQAEALILDGKGEKWTSALTKPAGDITEIPCDFDASDAGIGRVFEQGYDLVVTEEGLKNLSKKSQGRAWNGMTHIAVFSRMSPRGKARVIRSIQKTPDVEPKFVLMCGDGGNDVGALKQADVGLALLSGYGSANTSKGSTTTTDDPSSTEFVNQEDAENAEDKLNEEMANQKKKAAHFAKLRNQELEVKKQQLIRNQRQWIQEELEKLPESERGVMAQLGVMKNVTARLKRELQIEAALLDKKYGLAAVTSSTDKDKSDDPFAALEAEGAGMPMVRPGDASVAAPFTSRVPSVRSVVQLIRQGRCTLLSSLQQQQIMMLECTISAYTYAAISLEGARSSERQMMVSGWLVMAASLSFSYSTPVDKMHPVKPLRSLFHPAVFLSIFGQALIHLYSMSTAVKMATDRMGPEKLAEVVAFNKRVQAGLDVETQDDEDPLKMLTAIWQRPFMPNLMNTTVFLVETAQIMAVLFVNYKGRPFMKGLLENHALFLSLFICIGGVAFAAWEVLPEFNRALHFYPFPDDEYRWAVMIQIFLVVGGAFIWDRLVTAVFAPKVFKAMLDEAFKTTAWDLVPIFTSLFKTVFGFFLFATGNPIIWGIAWYARKRINAYTEEMDAKRLGLVK